MNPKIYQLLNLLDKLAFYAEGEPEKVQRLESYPEPYEVENAPQIVASKKIGKVTCIPSQLFTEAIALVAEIEESL